MGCGAGVAVIAAAVVDAAVSLIGVDSLELFACLIGCCLFVFSTLNIARRSIQARIH